MARVGPAAAHRAATCSGLVSVMIGSTLRQPCFRSAGAHWTSWRDRYWTCHPDQGARQGEGVRHVREGSPAVSVAFLVTTLIVVATPGTGVVYTLAAGLSRGRRASVVAALGCTLGIVPHMIATITGLAAVLHASAAAFQVLKLLGVAYLLFMAWATLRDRDALAVGEGRAEPRPAARVIASGALTNLLNPKLTLFFFAFLPQFVPAGTPSPVARMLMLSAVFMAVTFAVFSAYGILAATMREQVISRPRVMTWIRRVFAGSFAALGAHLATASR